MPVGAKASIFQPRPFEYNDRMSDKPFKWEWGEQTPDGHKYIMRGDDKAYLIGLKLSEAILNLGLQDEVKLHFEKLDDDWLGIGLECRDPQNDNWFELVSFVDGEITNENRWSCRDNGQSADGSKIFFVARHLRGPIL